jgi:hypothetical protein
MSEQSVPRAQGRRSSQPPSRPTNVSAAGDPRPQPMLAAYSPAGVGRSVLPWRPSEPWRLPELRSTVARLTGGVPVIFGAQTGKVLA